MLSGSSDRNTIQKFKEIKFKQFQKVFCGTLFWWVLTPLIVCRLSLVEDALNGAAGCQLFLDGLRIAVLICKFQLIAQVTKAIVHRRCGQHQYLCVNALADNFIQQQIISILLIAVPS